MTERMGEKERKREQVHDMFSSTLLPVLTGVVVQDPFDHHDTESHLKACLSFQLCSPCFLFDLCGFDLAIRRNLNHMFSFATGRR